MAAHYARWHGGAQLACQSCGSRDLGPVEHVTKVTHPYTDAWSWWCNGCGGDLKRYGSKAEAAVAAVAHEAERDPSRLPLEAS